MKKLTLITIFYLLITNFSFAATYPNSCPVEAKAIVEAVGGCSAVNKSQYPSVYEKCCVAPAPSTGSGQTITPKPAAPTAPKPPSKLEYTEPFNDFPLVAPSAETSEPATEQPKLENKPLKIIREVFRKIFDRLLRFFRLR